MKYSEWDLGYKLKDDFSAIQVCFEINGDNQARENNRLLASFKFFNLNEGVILTIDQTDLILIDGYKIEVIPAYKYQINL